MNNEFLRNEADPNQPPELTAGEWEAIDQARDLIAEQRGDNLQPYFAGMTAEGMFVSVDRPNNNDFGECVVWTGNVREMAAGALPSRHQAIYGYQIGPPGPGRPEPGQPNFGKVATVFEDANGNELTINIPSSVELRTAARPTIGDGFSGGQGIFRFKDQPARPKENSQRPEPFVEATKGVEAAVPVKPERVATGGLFKRFGLGRNK